MAGKSDQLIELRFTRARQAVVMFAWGFGLLLASAGLFVLHQQRHTNPPALFWMFIPLVPAVVFLWLTWSHLKHPYLALTRVGIEIYPFFLPARNMNLILWQQIAKSEVSETPPLLVLTRADAVDAKIFITLAPIQPQQRRFLARALNGVQEMREEVTAKIEGQGATQGA